ncbi:MAG: ABC transporter permease [Proteobacteria bacterium SW_6_67_9]|nr:MAG: ABC transporter permease [Proteobacteria bacterium SW_6_67_9]
MNELQEAFQQAVALVVGLDGELIDIVALSLQVSLTAVVLAAAVALPLGGALALARFPGRGGCVAVLNALMGLPPVVVGLVVYLLLSRAGPLGELGILFTPAAMVVAQAVLVLPLIAALTRQTIADLASEYGDSLVALGAGWPQRLLTLLWEGRFSLLTSVLAGFGRAIAEVGAVLIVGGNIEGFTRVMTTAIALETARGQLDLALGLGLVLLLLTVAVNAAAMAVGGLGRRRYGL